MAAGTLPAQAQQKKLNEFTFWGGYSFTSVKFLGKTQHSESQILAIGFKHQIKEYSTQKTLWYTADFIPYLHYYYPKRDDGNRFVERSGFGISPIGFMMKQQTDYFFDPFIQTTGGLIYMEQNFPTDRARKLNFTFDITLGANIPISNFAGISLGYKFHHISNAETGDENPGLDSNFLFITLQLE